MKLSEMIKELQSNLDHDGDSEVMIYSYGEWVSFDVDTHIRWSISRDDQVCYIDPDN